MLTEELHGELFLSPEVSASRSTLVSTLISGLHTCYVQLLHQCITFDVASAAHIPT